MGAFYGYNVLGHGASLRPHALALQPTAMLYMNAWGEAQWAAQHLPNTIVIHRQYQSYEDVMHFTKGKTLQELKARAAERLDNRVYINLACEPIIRTDEELRILVQEQLEAMRWAVANNVRVAGPHGAFYGLSRVEQYEILEPLTTYIAEHPDLLLFTVDEYFVGHAFSGVDQDNGQPNEPQTIQPDKWVASPVDVYWHMGRITNYFKWLVDNDYPVPKTVITEAGADALQDVEAWRTGLKKTAGYDNIRGWRSLTAQWVEWYGQYGWSAARAYFEMLYRFWKEVYRYWPEIIGSCIYSWGNNNDAQWLQFRLDENDADEYRRLMIEARWSIGEDTAVTYDLSKYILGDGRVYKLGGMGDETLRTRFVGGYGHQDKNEHWEQIWFDDRYIYRGMDTSPGDGKVYALYEGGRYGSVWSPRYWEVGKTFKRTAQVRFYNKLTGLILADYIDVTHLKFARYHKSFAFRSGIALSDVVELHAMRDKNGQPDTASFETYYYAKNYGLVGWKGSGVGESYISAMSAPFTHAPDTMSWFSVPTVPPTVEEPKPDNPDMPVTIENVKVQSNGPYSVRIRAIAGATGAILGVLPADRSYLSGREYKHLKTGLWRFFSFDNNIEGYVHSDYINVVPQDGVENPVVNIPTKAELDAFIAQLNALVNITATWRSKLL